MPVIDVERLSKSFRVRRRRPGFLGGIASLVAPQTDTVWAVRDVSFTVEPGEMIGYIGPNGAGKSTTIKMLAGILEPTEGRVRVRGVAPAASRREHARQIGVVFGQRSQLWWDLPLEDSFELLRAIYRVSERRYRDSLSHLTGLLELGELMRTPVRQLSLGQRMRGDLAAALLHEPPVLFLDEPTIGLDVVAKSRIRELLEAVNRERGVTVLLTTHDLDDIEKLCRRVLIIDRGRLLFDGAIDALKQRFGTHRQLVIDLTAPVDEAEVRAAVGDRAELTGGAHGRHVLRFARDAVSAVELIAAVSAKLPIRDLTIQEPAIDEIVAHIYREGL
jgi:ABC-2 type transport system ATP-binding protein